MANNIVIENILNRDDNSLPFGLYCPKYEGRLVWMCNRGEDGSTIICVYRNEDKGNVEKKVLVLENMEQAIYYRDELIKSGWRKLVPPTIKMTQSGKSRY